MERSLAWRDLTDQNYEEYGGTSEEPVGNTILSEFSNKILSTTTQL